MLFKGLFEQAAFLFDTIISIEMAIFTVFDTKTTPYIIQLLNIYILYIPQSLLTIRSIISSIFQKILNIHPTHLEQFIRKNNLVPIILERLNILSRKYFTIRADKCKNNSDNKVDENEINDFILNYINEIFSITNFVINTILLRYNNQLIILNHYQKASGPSIMYNLIYMTLGINKKILYFDHEYKNKIMKLADTIFYNFFLLTIPDKSPIRIKIDPNKYKKNVANTPDTWLLEQFLLDSIQKESKLPSFIHLKAIDYMKNVYMSCTSNTLLYALKPFQFFNRLFKSFSNIDDISIQLQIMDLYNNVLSLSETLDLNIINLGHHINDEYNIFESIISFISLLLNDITNEQRITYLTHIYKLLDEETYYTLRQRQNIEENNMNLKYKLFRQRQQLLYNTGILYLILDFLKHSLPFLNENTTNNDIDNNDHEREYPSLIFASKSFDGLSCLYAMKILSLLLLDNSVAHQLFFDSDGYTLLFRWLKSTSNTFSTEFDLLSDASIRTEIFQTILSIILMITQYNTINDNIEININKKI